MERIERFYGITRMLKVNRIITMCQIMDEFEISNSTAKRDIAYLRDRMMVPIIWDAELQGYRLDNGDQFKTELPGLWLSDHEVKELKQAVNEIAGTQFNWLDRLLTAVQ